MAAKKSAPKWTRASATNYLSNNPNFIFQKESSHYSEAQLVRYARAYSQGEQVGRDISQEEARGHLAYKPVHTAKTGRILERHTITATRPEKKPLTISDLKGLVKASTIKEQFNYVKITGVVEYKGVRKQHTLSGYVSAADLKAYMKDHKNTYEDLTDFGSFITGQGPWETVTTVEICYPQKEKKGE